jgi:predicted nucleotidyltransferase
MCISILKMDEILHILLDHFTATDRIHLAVFFCSYATGEARLSSDVDVVVYADSPLFRGRHVPAQLMNSG